MTGIARDRELRQPKEGTSRRILKILCIGIPLLAVVTVILASAGILTLLGLIGYTFIGPGSHVDIIYPAPNCEMPEEFKLVGTSSRWFFGYQSVSWYLFSGTSYKLKLNTRGMKAKLYVDGKAYKTSDKKGKVHIFKLKLKPGRHEITFQAGGKRRTIPVTVRKSPRLYFIEESQPSLAEKYFPRKSQNEAGGLGVRLQENSLLVTVGHKKVEYPISEIQAIKKRYKSRSVQNMIRQIGFPKPRNCLVKVEKATPGYAITHLELTLDAIGDARNFHYPSLTHELLIYASPSSMEILAPPRTGHPRDETFIELQPDGRIIWVQRTYIKDIDFGEVVFVWEPSTKRWNNVFNVARYLHLPETSPNCELRNTLHRLKIPLDGLPISRETECALTETGLMVVVVDHRSLFLWNGEKWCQIYVPIIPLHEKEHIAFDCGRPVFRGRNAFFFARDVSFEPCSPEIGIVFHGARPFVEVKSKKRVFKRKLYRMES